jgi:hypothetical protein
VVPAIAARAIAERRERTPGQQRERERKMAPTTSTMRSAGEGRGMVVRRRIDLEPPAPAAADRGRGPPARLLIFAAVREGHRGLASVGREEELRAVEPWR